MRRAFSKAICDAAEKNPEVLFLTGDLGFQVFDDFVRRYGPRYINAGIAEAQMVSMAGGLAKEGFRPIVYSIASFMTARPFEQIRVCVAYPGVPVVIVGAGGGYTYASSGVTHHSPDDLGLMSMLPGMTVVAPGSPSEIGALLPQLLALKGPSYMRIGKFGEPELDSPEPAVLGKARRLVSGEKVSVISTGDLSFTALEAVRALKEEGVNPSLYHFHTVKPLDTAALEEISSRDQWLIVAEEASPRGGLAAAAASFIASSPRRIGMVRLGPPDEFLRGGPERAGIASSSGYDRDGIMKACREAWGSAG